VRQSQGTLPTKGVRDEVRGTNWRSSRGGNVHNADIVLISYDELHDLVNQAEMFAHRPPDFPDRDFVGTVERQTKRPLHPLLGGETPYELDPRMLAELPIQ